MSGLLAPALKSQTSLSETSDEPSTSCIGVWMDVGPCDNVSRHRAKNSADMTEPPEPTAIACLSRPAMIAFFISALSNPETMATVSDRRLSFAAKRGVMPLPRPWQIGRASGEERVGQDV